MKYGIVADVHGNFHALKAVIDDGLSRGVESFIFVGDYFGDMPYPNEVYELMKSTPGHVIRGNKEDYLVELHMSSRSMWTHVQFAALYWNYDEFSEEHLFDLINLPEDMTLIDKESNKEIFITHNISQTFKETKLDDLTSFNYSTDYDSEKFVHEDYLQSVHETLNDDHLLELKLNKKTPDIYIFGHTHLQWYTQAHNKVFINPGSCGKPLDYQTTAPYTILELDHDKMDIEEVRVTYDINLAIHNLYRSQLYNRASDWSDIVISELKSGKDLVSVFFNHLFLVAKDCGEDSWPVSSFVWNEAISIWKDKSII